MRNTVFTALFGSLLVAGCAQPGDERADASGATCSSSVIVGLASAPGEALLADLGRASGSTLALERALATDLYLLTLEAPGDRCAAALEALRRDSRVRSADLDQRRQIPPPAGSASSAQ